MTTKYPASIDTTIELPYIVDNSTPVGGSIINNLRDAVVALENELGIKPSGIYTNVRTRISALEIVVGNLVEGTVTFGGDLTTITNTTQKVTGLQAHPVNSVIPTDGYLLTWLNADGYWAPRLLSNSSVSSTALIDYSKFGVGTQSLAAQQFNSTVDTKGTIVDVQPKNVQTTNATATTLDSFTIASNTTLIVSAVITAVKSDNSQGASYIRSAVFRNNAGTVAQISTTQDGGTFEDDATWDATIDNATTTIRIRVTGKAATTIRWTCISTRLEVQA